MLGSVQTFYKYVVNVLRKYRLNFAALPSKCRRYTNMIFMALFRLLICVIFLNYNVHRCVTALERYLLSI